MKNTTFPNTKNVASFWEENPLCFASNPYTPGSEKFFKFYDAQREEIEPPKFSLRLHEYNSYSKKNVLDVGCGNAYVLSKYALQGANVFGVDITKTAIDISKKRFKLLGIRGVFKKADAEKLPFAENSFDLVCSMGVLHHVPDTEKAIKEIFRVLKPGGKFISMFYHRNSARYYIYFRALSILRNKPMTQVVNENDGIGNPKAAVFTKKQLRNLVPQFEKIELFVDYLPTRDIILRGSRFFPKNTFKPLAKFFGWNLYLKARKPSD